jgi:hypothetical protein
MPRTRGLIALVLAAVLAPLVVFGLSNPANADVVGVLNIKTYGNETCAGENQSNTIRIELSTCTGSSYQHWYTTRLADGSYQFENTHDSRCLFDYFGLAITVSALGCDPTVAVDSWQNIAPPATFVVLRNEYTGNCLSHNVLITNGTPVTAAVCNFNDINQRWNLRT